MMGLEDSDQGTKRFDWSLRTVMIEAAANTSTTEAFDQLIMSSQSVSASGSEQDADEAQLNQRKKRARRHTSNGEEREMLA